MKKFTLVLMTLLSLIPTSIWAEEVSVGDINYEYTPVTVGTGAAKVKSCLNAATITIPDVVTIGDFDYNVTNIDPDAFKDCSSLTTLRFESSNLPEKMNVNFASSSVDYGLYIIYSGVQYAHEYEWSADNNYFRVYKYDSESASGSDINISSKINNIHVTEIANDAFLQNNVSGINLTIPSSITTIGNTAFANITTGNKLASITVEEGNPKYKSFNGILYTYAQATSETEEILELVTCPISISSSMVWADGITSIGNDAFMYHDNLSSLTIPASVKRIGQSAFQYAGKNTNLNISIPSNSQLATIENNAFQESGLSSITIPDGVITIGNNAFKLCKNLTSIKLPSTLTSIGASAFYNCENLTMLEFSLDEKYPETTISSSAFYNCKLQETIEIPSGVTSIENNAFNYDETFRTSKSPQLKTLRIPATVTNYGNNVAFRTVTIERELGLEFDGKYATYFSTIDVALQDGLKAYTITAVNGTSIETKDLKYIHKGKATLLELEEGRTISKWFSTKINEEESIDFNEDVFKGSTTGVKNFASIPGNKYVLEGDNFVKAHQDALPPFRCFIVADGETASTLYIKDGNNNTIIIQEEGVLVNKNNTSIGSVSLSDAEGGLKKLTVTPGTNYYAYKDDITVRRNVTARSGRAPSIDNTTYDLIVDGDPDPSKLIEYTFDPQGASVFEVTVNFHKRRNLSNTGVTRMVELDHSYNYIYDGTEKKPSILSVKYGDETVNAKNYTYNYLSNTNAGTGIVRITGQREYKGTYDKTFTISKRDINNVTVMAIPDQIYNGGEIKPVVVVKDIVLIDGVDVDLINKIEDKPDYSLEFINNINAGTAQVNVLSNNINYRGVKTGTTFTILPKDLSLAGNKPTIEPIEIQIYTGEPLKPALVIRDGDLLVTPDNYDVEYDNNIVEGTANATVTFKKNYKGTAKTTFEIVYLKESKKLNVDFGNQDEWTTYYSPIDLENVEGLNIFVVTGLNKGQDIDLKTEQINYIPKNIGVLLQRTDKTKTAFTGETMSSNTKQEGVTPDTDLFRGTATGIDDLKTIDGIKYILQNDRFIQVTEGALPANRCYVFINNENDEGINHVEGDDPDGIVIQEEGESSKTAGTVTLSEVSSDGYKTITVEPASVVYATQDEVKVVRSIKNDTPAASSHRVPGIENTLVEIIPVNPSADPSGTTQYKFKYNNAYHYQITVDFQKRINLSDPAISHPVVTLKAEDIQSLEYDGKEKRPRVEKVACNNIEVDPSNYTISYENNVNAGMPRVVITGKRFLMGSTHAEFSISKRNFSHVTVEEPIADKEYTSLPITPTLVIKDIVDGKNIVNANDYELILENNVKVGTAKVTLKPKNNYYGSYKDFYFNIIPAKYLKGDVNGDGLVNVTDIVETVNYIMEKPSNKFNKEAADVNGDSEVNVTDIVMMVSIIMNGDGGSSRRTAATSSNLIISGNNIQLRNAETYTAAQFDINLSDGQSISNVVLNGSSDHDLYWKMIDTNTCRVVVYSMTNAAFCVNDDNLFTIFMTGGQGTTINNELLIKANGTTGIDAIRTEAENGKVYDLSGRQVKNPGKGIYIINGKKMVAK